MNAIFTIVAKNYIGLAQVLEKSVKANCQADFFIIVADELEEAKKQYYNLSDNVLMAKHWLGYTDELWYEMAFKYNLVEFCTAIKPACFKFFLEEKKYDKVIYLDPDIFIFNSIEPVFAALDNTSILLTPHIISMQTPFKGDYPDHLFLINGTFNLGFLGLKKSETAGRLLHWWESRLQNECFSDNDRGTITDQKWMNLLPSFFSARDMQVSFNRGLNVAPWNYFERQIQKRGEHYFVNERGNLADKNVTPLVFVHFSGYDYRGFCSNKVSHKKEDFKNYGDMEPVFEDYANALKEGNINRYMDEQYSYNQFENGINIISIQRRIYRRLLEEDKKYNNPFITADGSFYSLLKQKGIIDYSKISADKVTNKNIPAFGKKLRIINIAFNLLKKMIGIRKYSMFIRFLRRYAREENQVFLVDKEIGTKMQ